MRVRFKDYYRKEKTVWSIEDYAESVLASPVGIEAKIESLQKLMAVMVSRAIEKDHSLLQELVDLDANVDRHSVELIDDDPT